MKLRARTPLVILFIAIFAAWWGVSVLSNVAQVSVTSPQVASANTPVIVHHTHDGINDIFTGSLSLPSCTSLSTGVQSVGLAPREVTIELSTANCTSTSLSDQPFEVEVASADSQTLFEGVTLNGMPLVSELEEN